jgi:6-phosphogluconolactonase
MYSLLAEDPYRSQLRWDRIHFFWGDERCVPPNDPQSNFRMASAALLSRVPVPLANIHRIKGEIEPTLAATEYEQELGSFFKARAAEMPRFDLLLLGLGTDGHTASLFPGTAALLEREKFCVANWIPKLDAWRITFTLPVINNSAQVMFLVAGADKAEVIRSIRQGDRSHNYPAQNVDSINGRVVWLLDSAAAGE